MHCDHEYLNFRGGKFSKGRGAFVDVPYFLSRYDPDPPALLPDRHGARDPRYAYGGFRGRISLSPKGQHRRAGGHTFAALSACLGPLRVANRMLSFAYKRFDGRVPEPGALDEEDRALLKKVEAGFETVGELP